MLMRNPVLEKVLTLDFEFRAAVKIKDVGIYNIVEHPTAKILCVAAEYQGREFVSFDMNKVPDWFLDALADPEVMVHAHNATVERLIIQRICTPKHGWPEVRTKRFRCSAARAARLAIPRALDKAGHALGLDTTKDKDGTNVMRRLAYPIKFTDQGPVYDNTPEKLDRLGKYCLQDVRAEKAIDAATFPMPESEERFYQLTERINDRGVKVDRDLVARLMWRAKDCEDILNARIHKLTDGAVPKTSQVSKLKAWIEAETGHKLDKLDKQALTELLDGEALPVPLPGYVKDVLRLRAEGNKTSAAKLKKILARVGADHILRGEFVFNGASTGRYTSMGVQLQNLMRETLENFEKDIQRLEEFTLPEIAKTLRQCFIPREGHVFIDADYNAIEARGVAWLAGATRLLNIYRSGGDPYCDMGTAIYGFEVTKEDKPERFVGKQTILGCGYGMGWPKFLAQCEKYGQTVTEKMAEKAVKTYRQQFPEIPALWYEMTDASIEAVDHPGRVVSAANGKIKFLVKDGYLQMKLPSGRRLFYKSPKIISREKFGREMDILTFMSQHSITKQWTREETWGGKLVENAVQAICRDLLFEAMYRIDIECEIDIVLSVHDQVVSEVLAEDAEWAKKTVKREMEKVPEWARGFPIYAEPNIALRFGK